MIKLADLLSGTVRDPFTGELYEGLITTVELRKAAELLQRNASTIVQDTEVTSTGELEVHVTPNYPDQHVTNYTTGGLQNPQLSDLLKLINNLGYYITAYIVDGKYQKYNSAKFRDLIVIEEPKELMLILSAKYDEEQTNLPATVFHVTNSMYLPKIKQIGLKPTTQSKLADHPERIYLALDRESAELIAKRMQQLGKYEPQLLVIDTTKLPKNLKFYNDPHFSERGVYTLGNIPLNAITKIENI